MIGTHLPNTTTLDDAMIELLRSPASVKPCMEGARWRRKQMGLPLEATAPPINPQRQKISAAEKRAGGFEYNTTEPLMPAVTSSPRSVSKHRSKRVQAETSHLPRATEHKTHSKGRFDVTPQLVRDKDALDELMVAAREKMAHARELDQSAQRDLLNFRVKCADADSERELAERLARECLKLEETVQAVERGRKEQLRLLKATYHDAMKDIAAEPPTTTELCLVAVDVPITNTPGPVELDVIVLEDRPRPEPAPAPVWYPRKPEGADAPAEVFPDPRGAGLIA